MTGLNPFGNSPHTSDTLRFIDTIAFIRSSGFSIAELHSLLEKSAAASQPIDGNNIANVLAALRDGLKKIELLDPGDTPDEQEKIKRQNQNNLVTDTLATLLKQNPRSSILNQQSGEIVGR